MTPCTLTGTSVPQKPAASIFMEGELNHQFPPKRWYFSIKYIVTSNKRVISIGSRVRNPSRGNRVSTCEQRPCYGQKAPAPKIQFGAVFMNASTTANEVPLSNSYNSSSKYGFIAPYVKLKLALIQEGCTNVPKTWQPSQTSTRQKGDMQQVSY
jgi:hypothetical protein